MAQSKELMELRQIIRTWKESYLKLVRESGGGEILAKDFEGEIEEFAFPYVMRMYRSEIITEEELKDFMDFCHSQVMEFRTMVEKEDRDA